MRNYAANAYQNNKVVTASPAELTLMLYEGAIKFCNIAKVALEKGEREKGSLNLIKAERIIAELRATLDPKYPVYLHFERVYEYIYRRLAEANIQKNVEILDEALGYIREMRDTWKEVMRLNRMGG